MQDPALLRHGTSAGVAAFQRLEVLSWLHLSRRDLVRQSPANSGISHGTFSLDLKLDRTLFTPIAPPQEGDFQVNQC